MSLISLCSHRQRAEGELFYYKEKFKPFTAYGEGHYDLSKVPSSTERCEICYALGIRKALVGSRYGLYAPDPGTGNPDGDSALPNLLKPNGYPEIDNKRFSERDFNQGVADFATKKTEHEDEQTFYDASLTEKRPSNAPILRGMQQYKATANLPIFGVEEGRMERHITDCSRRYVSLSEIYLCYADLSTATVKYKVPSKHRKPHRRPPAIPHALLVNRSARRVSRR